MALNVDYVVRETALNLKRNAGLTIASILTVVVALALVGSSFILQKGVDHATSRWKSGVEVIVFMQPDATTSQIQAVGKSIGQNPEVKKLDFFDKNKSFAEFKRLFADSPEMLQSVEPSVLPPSFRIVPVNAGVESVAALRQQYIDKAGVLRIVSADDALRQMENLSGFVSNMVVVAAMVLGVTAAVLIFNTTRMAMFARRREIEVMKLVGATNWFIRVPFMLEGLFQGLVGGVLAIGALRVGYRLFSRRLASSELDLLAGFQVSSGSLWAISVVLLVVGVLTSFVFSGIAATRYLDV